MTSRVSRIKVLDGGLGTTLEDTFHHDISTPLWSARPINHEPEVIVEAHLAFLRAGARIISTATYQSAFSTFERSGYTRADAVRLMRKAVALARTAKERFLAERSDLASDDVQIALSLGPYGAMNGMHEFDGMYPPPYGPELGDSAPRNFFLPGEEDQQARPVDALEAFYLERLRVYAGDDETWRTVDWVAFETVPLTREITAIRRAMRTLEKELSARYHDGSWKKRWWISTVFPFGLYPEKTPDGGSISTVDVARAILGQDEEHTLPVPDGIGVNCTGVRYLTRILVDIEKAVQELGDVRPWLLLYPNGREWDVETDSWVAMASGEDEAADAWASAFVDVVAPHVARGDVWGGLIVGGCCKSGPKEIAALEKAVEGIEAV